MTGKTAGLAEVKKSFATTAMPANSDSEKLALFERLLDGEMKVEDFPEISPEFLSMPKAVTVNEETWNVPAFAVFDINTDGDHLHNFWKPKTKDQDLILKCVLETRHNLDEYGSVRINSDINIGSRYPSDAWVRAPYTKLLLRSWIEDVAKNLLDCDQGGWVFRLRESYEFSKIPKRLAMLLIRERAIFDQLLLIKDANWEIEKIKVIPQSSDDSFGSWDDPLIVGRKGKKFYLLHVFDATTIEHYVSKEFTKTPKARKENF